MLHFDLEKSLIKGIFGRKKNSGAARRLLLIIMAAAIIAIGYASVSSGPARNSNVKVVSIDLAEKGLTIRPEQAVGKHEMFDAMMKRLKPYAAIDGTYYDENFKPLGDILINGKLVNRGAQRNAIAITRSGKIEFIQRRNGKFDWSGYWTGLAAGPRLIHKGKIALDPVADGFSKKSLTIKAWRSGVGKTKDGKLLLVTAKEFITLRQFADVMLDLGAVEAMNLDGGGACGLYHKGDYLASPTLRMTNVLAIYRKAK